MSIESIAIRFSKYISKNVSLSLKEEKKIYYGTLITLLSVIKLVSILLVSYILGCFAECLIIILVYGTFKSFTGGYHCDTYIKCLCVGLILFNLVALMSNRMQIDIVNLLYIHLPTTIVFLYLIFQLYPIKNEVRPVKLNDNKIKLSLVILTLLYMIGFLILYTLKSRYLIAYSFGFYLNIFFTLHVGKLIISLLNKSFDILLRKGDGL
jgi:accessory gene regulator B